MVANHNGYGCVTSGSVVMPVGGFGCRHKPFYHFLLSKRIGTVTVTTMGSAKLPRSSSA
jgi:hypothetical protein